ncbi:ATP-binding protein [Paenibacillus rigui]|uniref:ATP-binding protein n=1 Tax=Paenibacillus rigui TaxID=554312 RepID=UPI003CCBEA45
MYGILPGARSEQETRAEATASPASSEVPEPKTLQEFEFAHIPKLPKMKVEQLAQITFIPRRENVICIG